MLVFWTDAVRVRPSSGKGRKYWYDNGEAVCPPTVDGKNAVAHAD